MTAPLRKLAAILAADVAGYSKLMGEDETGTLDALRELRQDLSHVVTEHRGEIVKSMGDGWLVEFASVVDAVNCALQVQENLADHEIIKLRIGIHIGDIVHEDEDIYGDGVNIAARLQEIAAPGGIVLSDMARKFLDSKLANGFRDAGEKQLKNIAEAVRVYVSGGGNDGAIENAPLALPDKPSIAVLPFDNMSGDPEQEYFSDGLTEDIISALSTIRWLFVIARNSSFTYKSQAVDIKKVGRELGVRYVLEGSVRKAGNRVRVTAQLIEADSGSHVWADRFDGTIEDIFELQDELTAKIVGALGPEMTRAEIEMRRNKAPAHFDAWDYYLRAMSHFHALTEPDFEQAVGLLKQSIEIDPDFAGAFALLGHCHAFAALHGWSGRKRDNVQTALEYARKSILLDPLNAQGHSALAQIYHTTGPMDEVIAAAERALELEPNNANYWRQLGGALSFSGRPDEALAAVEKAERGSPRDPQHFHVALDKASAYFVAGRLEESFREARQAVRLQPNFYAGHAFTAACAGLLGKEDEARAAVQLVLKLVPRFSVAAMRRNPMFERPEDLERMIEGFRLAGLPEE